MNANLTTSLSDLARSNDMTTREAVRFAILCGYSICKYADPVEGGRAGLNEDEAIEIAGVDVGLLYCTKAA